MNPANENSRVETPRGTQRPRFSILHTSARPQAWRAVYDAWLAAADRPEDVEYILVCDERWGFKPLPDFVTSDPAYSWRGLRAPTPTFCGDKVYFNEGRRCYVEGVNLAATHATGDILIVVADDQFPCEHWDTEIGVNTDPRFVKSQFVLWAPTGTPSEFDRGIIVMPIMSRALYERWGYVLYPSYESMYSDNDLCEHAKAENVLIDARDLPVFPHRHYLFTPGVENDAAYAEQNRAEAYEQGKRLLMARRANGFKDGISNPPTPIRSAVAKPAGGDTRPSIQPCIPGETFSRDWVMAWTSLIPVMSEHFRLFAPVSSYSSAPHVTRQSIRESILRGSVLPDFVLWIDDDNILSPDGLLQLYADFVEHPEIQLAAGWSWDSGGGSITAGLEQDGKFGRFEHHTLMEGPDDLFRCDWTGFPAVLMRGSLLVDAGPMAFVPIPNDIPPFYTCGEDISFCMRVKNHLKVIDRRVRVPHLKLRDNQPFPGNLKPLIAGSVPASPEAKHEVLEMAGTPA